MQRTFKLTSLYSWLLIVTTFLFIYNIPFKFIPIGTGKIIAIISFITIGYLILKRDYKWIIKKEIINLTIFIISLTIFSLIINFVKGSEDISVIYTYILFLLEYLLGGIIIIYLLKKRGLLNFENILYLLIITMFIQSLITNLMLINTPFREFIFSITENGQKFKGIFNRYGGFRGLGLATSVTYDFAVLQSFGLIFLVVLLPKRFKSLSQTVLGSLMFISIMISSIISGRTSYLGIAIAGLFLIINLIRKKNIKQYFIFIISILMILALSFILGSLFLPQDTHDNIKDNLIIWVLEPFISIKEEGEIETKSTNTLKNMYKEVKPENYTTGEGYFFEPNGKGYYRGTDAGYTRLALYYGVIGSVIHYLMFIYVFLTIYKKMKGNKSFELMILPIALLIYFFIVQVKGAFLIEANMDIKLLFLLFMAAIYENHDNKIKYII